MTGSDERRFILILGGVRSGKSDLAQKLALDIGGGNVLFLATAAAGDGEMARRIAAHQAGRPAGWRTVEEPIRLADALERDARNAKVVLIDCVTLWMSNILMATSPDGGETPDQDAAEALMNEEMGALSDWRRASDASLIVVSNEVGMGVTPPYPSGRVYRDLLGLANQALATRAGEVYLTVAGIPVDLKQLMIRPWRQDTGSMATN
ncbi:MAG: bifunctional adenosylcobinamide kinase/adenosylcobinamide-phosphate guanylyltransferase [Chloroflexi bacterium]|nr:bifunctional adenosylcobinamide kinase/adenosylcobinamide-phosphate guanylyltransferase [Chloroflexota bacterium]